MDLVSHDRGIRAPQRPRRPPPRVNRRGHRRVIPRQGHNALKGRGRATRRVAVPGGTGRVGEGVVRGYLAAGAEVVVPTRTRERAEEFRRVLGDAVTDRLHLVVHDYSTFAGAEEFAATMERRGGVDDVVAPIGRFWGGKHLWEIDEADWQSAFVGLATANVAVMRAFVPRLNARGAYTVVVGESAMRPVPGSGLVSMEQTALLMMPAIVPVGRGAAVAGGGIRRRRTGCQASSLLPADLVTEALRPQVRPGNSGPRFGLGWPLHPGEDLAGLVGGAPGAVVSLLIAAGTGRASVAMTSRLIPTAIEQVNVRLLRPNAGKARDAEEPPSVQ